MKKKISKRRLSQLLRLYVENKLPDEERKFIDAWYEAIKEPNTTDLTEKQHSDLQEKMWKKLKGGL